MRPVRIENLIAAGLPRNIALPICRVSSGENKPCKYSFSNNAGVGEIRIYGEIGWDNFDGSGMTPTKFAQALEQLGEITELVVRINSPGGYVWDGFTIHNMIAQLNVPTKSIIEGIAASAASFIALGSDSVAMMPLSKMMIHRALVGVMGNARELRELAVWLEGIDQQLASCYEAKGKKTAAEFLELMDAETYLDPAQAVELGLADEVLEVNKKGKAAASGGGVSELTKQRIAALGRKIAARRAAARHN